MIDWHSFTWEAFAILATGFAAVGAATAVAWRQSRIVERQVDLQQLALRHEMFDRRVERVYQPVREVLRQFGDLTQLPTQEATQTLAHAGTWAKMLFEDNVSTELARLLSDLNEILHMIDCLAREDVSGEERARRQSEINMKRVGVLFYDAFLEDIFGAELRLAEQ